MSSLELYETLLAQKRLKGLEDLYFFNKFIVESNPNRRKFIVPHVHKEWTDWYQNSKKRIKMILVPRGSFKSTFFTVGKSLQAIAKNRNERILIANATLANAQNFLSEIKDHIIKNEEYKMLYSQYRGKVTPMFEKNLRWNEDQIEVAGRDTGIREPTITAVGVGGNLVSQHYSFILADDLVSDVNSATRYLADKVIDWWKRSFSLLDPEGEMLIIGTRWAYYELYSYIIEKLPEEVDIYIHSAYNKDGSLYFPERLGSDKLKELRNFHGSYFFCNPGYAPILMQDWSYKPISKVKSGDVIIGWKKKKIGKRSLCKSRVIRVESRYANTVKLKMESGREIVCTPEHKWFTGRYEKNRREYAPAKIGSTLRFILDPKIQNNKQTKEQKELSLWLGGLFDGDGGFCGDNIFFAQDRIHNPEVCEKIEYALNKIGYKWNSAIRKPKYDKRLNHITTEMMTYWINGGIEIKRKFIFECNPSKRFKIIEKMYKRGCGFVKHEDKVIDIIPYRSEKVFALETETGNYIVWGYASSNSAFYLLDPVDEESALIKKDQILYYGDKEDTQLPKNLTKFSLCDPAVSQQENADYSTIVTIGVDQFDNWYVLEVRREKWTVGTLVDNLFSVYKLWKPNSMSIEVIGQAQGLMTPIRMEEQRRAEEGKPCYLPLVEIKSRPQYTKEMRIRSVLQPRFERGKVFIRRDMFDLEEELLKFPKAKHDDIIDPMTDMEEIAYAPNEEKVEITNNDGKLSKLSANLHKKPEYDEYMGEDW